MPAVLIVYHSLGGNTEAAAEAVADGARQVEGVDVTLKDGLKASAEDLLSCDAVALGTPDYHNYMAGGLKDFFDRVFYPTEGKVTGKPCLVFVTHGGVGRAVDSVKDITAIFKFKNIQDSVLVEGRPQGETRSCLEKAGRKLAEAARET